MDHIAKTLLNQELHEKHQFLNKKRIMEIGWRDIELVVDLSRTYLIQILDLYGFLKFDNVRTLQN